MCVSCKHRKAIGNTQKASRVRANLHRLKDLNYVFRSSGLLRIDMFRMSPAMPVYLIHNTVRSESRCALRLRYVDLVVSIEVAVAVCCCFTVFSC
jgi:hypothetical protein